ncbi:hypothetical protein FBZ93_12323 [Bradyrhizobium macuxiense]|uniref:Uncharacterized protein n=1 Tax=Bradyrhizobium macuxiense TaxID=1755647 RepID=A0A560KYC1_9BRAD|nr:hypothetical protein [Bradyrhizobium macuxiense]TWB87094.1 hypothetical protein FBZ93_12323 [Bradyrhizobium macuxiense]
MKWMKERDLLIAQTMAFVQSVKGKLPDAEVPAPARRTAATPAPQPATPPVATEAKPEAKAETRPTLETEATVELKPAAEAPREAPRVVMPPPLPVPTVLEGLPPAPSPLAVTVVEVPPPAQPPHFPTLDIRGDFGSEVRERVANFRAQQQRFLKEREEYCTTTMAKVRAAIRDNSELPRSGK